MPNQSTTIFAGNPGAGKSTLLNGCVGSPEFKSGISLGEGLTTVLQKFVDTMGNIWADTPGLADPVKREEAGKEIEAGLKSGGLFRIIFVVTLEAGRVRPDDIATVRLIHQSCPTIGTNYSIIVNKISPAVQREIDARPQVIPTQLNLGLPGTNHIFYMGLDYELMDMADQVANLPGEFFQFLANVPIVAINPEDVSPIRNNDFDALKEEMKATLENLRNSNEALQAEIIEQRKRHEESDRQHREDMKLLQQNYLAQFKEMQKKSSSQYGLYAKTFGRTSEKTKT